MNENNMRLPNLQAEPGTQLVDFEVQQIQNRYKRANPARQFPQVNISEDDLAHRIISERLNTGSDQSSRIDGGNPTYQELLHRGQALVARSNPASSDERKQSNQCSPGSLQQQISIQQARGMISIDHSEKVHEMHQVTGMQEQPNDTGSADSRSMDSNTDRKESQRSQSSFKRSR